MITLPPELLNVTAALIGARLRPVVVGGYIRDALLSIPCKDIDIEVFGAGSIEELKNLLLAFGKVYEVGKSFGVLKLNIAEYEVDFSLPRTEVKTGSGHQGFCVTTDGSLDFKTAALRRDFTINAMGYDIASQTLLDPYGGEKDLHDRLLRCVDASTFVEDPLRIFRALQFAARFELSISPDLLALCRDMVESGAAGELPKERIFEEFRKLLLKAEHPSLGFELMEPFGLLKHYSELQALKNTPQDPIFHPEGDVWTHTMLSLDVMAGLRTGDARRDIALMLAVLCHDFGKPHTTQMLEGRLRSYGHEEAGLQPTLSFLEQISNEKRLIEVVLTLVRHHGKPYRFFKEGAKDGAFRRLALNVDLNDLLLVAKADYLGRTTEEARSGIFVAEAWFAEHIERLGLAQKQPQPLLKGRDLIAEGLTPSETFKGVLNAAFEAQLDGEFSTLAEAKLWLSKHLKSLEHPQE